jgi:cobalt-zinc-cadmium efflux system outer membrane protein
MSRAVVVAVVCLCSSTSAFAQTILTLDTVVARARVEAGSVRVARARVAEAEAALVEASVRRRTNPLVEASAGPRFADPGRTVDLDIGLSQPFESRAQRAARIDAARAGIDRERALVDDVERAAVFEAARAFIEVLAARDRLRIAEEADAVARDLLAATERRYAAGDIAAIDQNQARIEAARWAAARAAASADLAAASGVLRERLRLTSADPIDVQGTLDLAPPVPIDQLNAALARRADLAALAAEARAADAETRLGLAMARPDLGMRVGYSREGGDTIVLGGLTVTLPAFQRGQGTQAAGRARASRVNAELDVARARALTQLDTAYASYQQHAALASTFATGALPSLQDNEDLARRSYEAGEMGLLDYLLIRRDALQTRTAIVEHRLEAARVRVAIDYIAGVLR